MSIIGSGSSFLITKSAGGGGATPTLQQVTTAGNVTTVQSLFNGGIRGTIAGGNTIAAFTNTDVRAGFSNGSPATMQVNHSGGNFGLAITRSTNDSAGANFLMFKTRGTTAATNVALQDNDAIAGFTFQGVCANGTSVSQSVAMTFRGVPNNTAGEWGAGLVPNNRLAGIWDVAIDNIAGLRRQYLRLCPNGEWIFLNVATGSIVTPLFGMMMQVRGTAGIQDGLNVGAIATNNASAVLEVTSTTKGVLPARMTNAQRAAIAAPAIGLEVYCTDAPEGKYINTSTGWQLQSPVVLSATVTLTDAEIKALPTTYKQIVPAPGAGKMLNFISSIINLDATAGAYTNIITDGLLFVGHDDYLSEASCFANMPTGASKNISSLTASTISNSTYAGYLGYAIAVINNYSFTDLENKPLKLHAINTEGDFTGGNAANTLQITVYYTITDI
jgi:hypothetical protein